MAETAPNRSTPDAAVDSKPAEETPVAEMNKTETPQADKAEQQQSSEAGSAIPPSSNPDAAVANPQASAAASVPSPEAATSSSSPEPSAGEPTATVAKGKEKETAASTRARQDSLSINPSENASAAAASPASDPAPPTCNITLLLPTGARHPYKIDERYLAKRNVDIPDLTEDGKKDPFSISIYKLKELILREWRDEWDGKPTSPSSIRLIHFGKLLDDKEQLKRYQLSAETPNVIHMSVRPAEMMEEDEGAKGKSSASGSRSRDGGGCCVIL